MLEIREGDAVTIKQIENSIINRAWDEGWVVPQPPAVETGLSAAVVGAGPAGMAAAQQLRRAGHRVVLFERDEAGGGLVRFGVPDFKIEKWVVERRLDQLRGEGVEIRCGVDVGRDVTAEELRAEFDAVVLTIGSRVPRDLPVPGRELDGIHFAMEYLYVRNRAIAAAEGPEPTVPAPEAREITAAGKHVVVIGGGDTGADCVGHSIREGALSVTQLELLPEPPVAPSRRPHAVAAVAAEVPPVLRDGGGDRDRQGRAGLLDRHDALRRARTAASSALHYAQAERGAAVRARSRAPTARCRPTSCCWPWASCTPSTRASSSSSASTWTRAATSRPPPTRRRVHGVFAAGDARRGQSLIVWAINEGRQAARMADRYLHELGAADREPVLAGNVSRRRRGARRAAVARRRRRDGRRGVDASARASDSDAPRVRSGVTDTEAGHRLPTASAPLMSRVRARSPRPRALAVAAPSPRRPSRSAADDRQSATPSRSRRAPAVPRGRVTRSSRRPARHATSPPRSARRLGRAQVGQHADCQVSRSDADADCVRPRRRRHRLHLEVPASICRRPSTPRSSSPPTS